MALGTGYGCAVLADRSVSCWGAPHTGDTLPEEIPPRRIAGMTNIRFLTVGWLHACAVPDDGSVWCWGGATGGDGSPLDGIPRPVPGIDQVVAIETTGSMQTCALRSDDTVWCWGYDSYKSVGRPGGSSDYYADPQPVPGVTDIVQIAISDCHSCALRRDSTVLCWGRVNEMGDTSTPVSFTGLGPVRSIAAAQRATMAVRNDGSVFVWGANRYGELGLGVNAEFVATPTLVPGLAASSASGDYHTFCIALTDGRVVCSGPNWSGQHGTAHSSEGSFAEVPGATGVVAVEAGTWSSCGQRADGSFICWGQRDGVQGVAAAPFDPNPR
jgi:alpha-tubulin suppressor-like RCC1 family protein